MQFIDLSETQNGIVSNTPTTGRKGLVDALNVFSFQDSIKSRLGLDLFSLLPMGTISVQEVMSVNGVISVIAFSTEGVFLLSGQEWDSIAPKSYISGKTQFSFASINNILWASNGIDPIITYNPVNGECSNSACPFKAKFLLEYKNQLILLNTIEDEVSIPQRVRWSDIGNPHEWVLGNANFVDLVLKEDGIVGATIRNYNVYIYKGSSIIQMRWVGTPSIYSFEEDYILGMGSISNVVTYVDTDIFWSGTDLYGLSNSGLKLLSNSVSPELQRATIKFVFVDSQHSLCGVVTPSFIYILDLQKLIWFKWALCQYKTLKRTVNQLTGIINTLKGSIKTLSKEELVPNNFDLIGVCNLSLESSLLIQDAVGDIQNAEGMIAIELQYRSQLCYIGADSILTQGATSFDTYGNLKYQSPLWIYCTTGCIVPIAGSKVGWRKLHFCGVGDTVTVYASYDNKDWVLVKEVLLNNISQAYVVSLLWRSECISIKITSNTSFTVDTIKLSYEEIQYDDKVKA